MREDEILLELSDAIDPCQTVHVRIRPGGVSFRLSEETGIFVLTRQQWEVIEDAAREIWKQRKAGGDA